jgi:hypothetical protein
MLWPARYVGWSIPREEGAAPRVHAWSAFARSAQTWLLRVTIRASLFHPHRDIESLISGYGTDTTSLPGVEAFPSVEVGRCGFILGVACGAIRWLLPLEVACHRS